MKEKNIFQKLKNIWANFYLRRKVKALNYPARIVNYEEAGKIGILYTLDTIATYERIAGFVKKLQDEQKKVRALGLVKRKEDTRQFLPKLSFDFIYPGDLNWFGKPGGKYAEDFLLEELDLLLDVTKDDDFAAHYLFSLAKAKLKVGHSGAAAVQINRRQDMSLEEYLKEIDHYIRIIKKK
ncbi:MAG: hypothetical protein U5Q03_03400 [Bacteroidota bacterium]|nr:hypothetical protein [Bacteroidota bacterium]